MPTAVATKRTQTRTQIIAKCAILIALLTVSCFFTIPIGPVPFTLQTAVVILVALICTPAEAAVATGIYLIMGTIGLPVFSGMTGGIMRASAGFIFGFVIGSAAASALRIFLCNKGAKPIVADIVAAIVYMIVADVLGLVWYVFFGGVTAGEAFMVMLAPFIVIDCAKAVLAIAVGTAVRKALKL